MSGMAKNAGRSDDEESDVSGSEKGNQRFNLRRYNKDRK